MESWNGLVDILSLIIELFMMIAGFSAIVIYKMQYNDKLKTAATEIIEQIKEVEDALERVKENPRDLRSPRLYKIGTFMSENLWNKNRAILSKHLSEDDRRVIQKFYSSVEQMERARQDLVRCMADTWYHKSFLKQEAFRNHCATPSVDENEFLKGLNRFEEDGDVFVPTTCIEILALIPQISLLTGTSTYEKLSLIANKRKN